MTLFIPRGHNRFSIVHIIIISSLLHHYFIDCYLLFGVRVVETIDVFALLNEFIHWYSVKRGEYWLDESNAFLVPGHCEDRCTNCTAHGSEGEVSPVIRDENGPVIFALPLKEVEDFD